MPRHFAIETAYARNLADPLVLDIDNESFQLDPGLDVGRLAVLFTSFQDGLSELTDDNVPLANRVTVVDEKKRQGTTALAECLVAEDRQRFIETASRVDIVALSNIITWMLTEVSGQPTPTPPPSSSSGSSADGPASTDGAPPVGSTPSPSPQTVP